MATLSTSNLRFPAASLAGPYGVSSLGSTWYVVHKVTGRAKRIGRAGGVRVNYFARALIEAHRRNMKEN